ncbi:N-acetylglucosamine kinase-like BadF-type ATPase [Saccharopolyspora lacisalsi]|uniref:N-acetylglucosamine kinase-like BadF-type ATPase n=1 Tax=Halosaccharopolyspora lacisalsi TaxID=1000566 RepID=A0A839E5Q8_9PSEU|nr:BadF/BadG/BcrA/BcrD ATPase family protein [Halosaccharopolyspora lacisalsi]MBA8826661.1 N-acetylglucosamine kinase-like BadF-type ATPase [Halosaccharopolyspora lacisalsi]
MPHHDPALVLGLDVGGTSSRALVADVSGRELGAGTAGGGNPNSHRPERAAEQVASAARAALSGIDPGRVRGGVLGMAGVSAMTNPAVAEPFTRIWDELGLAGTVRVASDCEVSFAAGTDSPEGTVLIAGTGSIAARIRDHRLVATSGGYGWLLGDEGSAFWLGREAVRATLESLDREEHPRDPLVSAVLDRTLGDETGHADDLSKRLIATVNNVAPIRLAELAPLVTDSAGAGDVLAHDIVARAATLLADTAQAVRDAGDTTPIVLAGSLTGADNPLGAALRTELAGRNSGELGTAGPGAEGAVRLAALDLDAPSNP